MIKKWDALLSAVGLALLAFTASRIGWGAVIGAMREAQLAVVMIIGLSYVRLVLQTHAWAIALRLDGMKPRLRKLMLIRLASQAIGYLSVLGPLASEPMKISFLKKSGGSATTATLVDTGVYWFTTAMIGMAGCLSAVLLLAPHHRSLVRSLGIVGLILAGFLFLVALPKSKLAPLVNVLGPRCPGWLRKGQEIEIAIRQFKIRHPSSIRRMFWLGAACQFTVLAEVAAIFWCLNITMHGGAVLAVEGATRAIKIAAGWMPARIGVDESGTAAAFLAFGLSPAAGLTLALVRRFRDLLSALIGLTWFASGMGFRKIFPDRMPEVAYLKEEA